MPRILKAVSRASSVMVLLGLLNTSAWATTPPKQEKIDTSAPQAIRSEADLEKWMTYYYLHPQPELLVPAILFADSKGMLDGDAKAPMSAFLSRVFAANAEKIPFWTQQLTEVKPTTKPMLWTALWWSNTKQGQEELINVVRNLPETAKGEIQSKMAGSPPVLDKVEITSTAILDELWGAYSATGDDKYVIRVMSALPWTDTKTNQDYNRLIIGGAAKWSLTSNAVQHPGVMKVILKAREQHPALKPFIDKIVSDIQGNTSGQPARKAEAR